MRWPKIPVEQVTCFRPPHCPWPECPEHQRRDGKYRFQRHASYSTRRSRNIPRFRCLTCRRTFSRSTFSTLYYAKRPELLQPIAAGLVAGSAFRQLARSLRCSKTTVARFSARIGRHAMLLHAYCLQHLVDGELEPIVFDHFETFEFTQDYPVGVATPTGARSWFVYGLDPAPHGRGGRRSPVQQRRLDARPKRANRGRYTGSTRRTIDALLRLVPADESLSLISDAHADYPRAIASHPEKSRIRLRRHANPVRGPKGSKRSGEAIVRDRAMFAVDLLHKIFRHTLAHHRRETIAFPRRLNGMLERRMHTVIWRNLVKRRSERKRGSPTPAMWLGLSTEPWSWARVFSRRLFFHRIPLPDPWPMLYRREWTTPVYPNNERHQCRRAY